MLRRRVGVLATTVTMTLAACAASSSESASTSAPSDPLIQSPSALIADTAVAVGYSGFREGQHPDRGQGAVLPSPEEIAEDLEILTEHGFELIRLYDSYENSEDVLKVIRERDIPVRVLLGAWLSAELSSHETCAWVTEPVPAEKLQQNRLANEQQVSRAIDLATEYSDIVVAVNVGNETLVTWNDHLVSIESMVRYLNRVRDAIPQPVTTADNYLAWVEHAETLAAAADFAFVHTYPVWEGRDIQDGLSFTIENLGMVRAALPDTPIVIGEAGWPSIAVEFGARASEEKQRRYVFELAEFARTHNVTTFLFEAFDESWKGDPARPDGAEKHWGLFDIERRPKAVMRNGPLPGLHR